MVTASVVITTFNRPELLKRALRSALRQNFVNYEVLVVNDAGEEVQVPSNVLYFRFFENKGLAAARNFGISKARGRYVVCLDDDNELLPDFLKETVKCVKRYSFDAVGVGRVIQYKEFAQIVFPILNKFTSIDQAWLMKKDIFDNIQYDEALKANEDADFGIRLAKKYSRTVIKKPLCVVYDTENSLSFPDARELEGIKRFLNKNLKEYDDPNELRYLYRLAGRKFYRGGFKLKGLNYFWKSFITQPNFYTLAHLVIICLGWSVYDKFMTFCEKR